MESIFANRWISMNRLSKNHSKCCYCDVTSFTDPDVPEGLRED